MRSIIFFLISQSILLPLIAGLIRLRRIGKGYQPFFILLVIGFLTEILSFVLIKAFHTSNAIPINIYILVEWTLIAIQFHLWGFLKQRKQLFYGFLIVTALVWAVENLFFGMITQFSPWFRLFYSFLIVLLSVNKINYMITYDNRNLFRNPSFLICIGFIIYFLYMILYRWAIEVSVPGKSDISYKIIFLIAYVNALTNSIFAIAFLLIPARVKFSLK
ncbi:MAG TPA: hypothetical protein VK563_10285 [Puia sp.]|nr:hypothetical protein [Puia sp.]